MSETAETAVANAAVENAGRNPNLRMSVSTLEGFRVALMNDLALDDDVIDSPRPKKSEENDAIAALAKDSDDDDDDEATPRPTRRTGVGREDAGRKIHDLAAKHMRAGRYEEAAVLFNEIVQHQKDKYGEANPNVAAALHNVAVVYVKANSFDKALSPCMEAVHIRKKSLDEESLDTASSLVMLGTIYFSLKTKEMEPSLGAFREALQIRRAKLGEKDPLVGQLYGHIGNVYFEVGEYLAALANFEDALKIQRLSTMGNHEKGETLANIGTIRIKRQQYHEAASSFEEALSFQQLEYKDGHPQLIYTLDCLAYCLFKAEKNKEALRVYKKILRAQISGLGATHIECANTLNKMSAVNENMANYKTAQDCTKQALAIQEKALDYSHPDVVRTRQNLFRIEKSLERQI